MARLDDSGAAPDDPDRALDFDERGPIEYSLSAAPIHAPLEGQGEKRGAS